MRQANSRKDGRSCQACCRYRHGTQIRTVAAMRNCTWSGLQVPNHVSIRVCQFVAGVRAVLIDSPCGTSKHCRNLSLCFLSVCSCH